MSRISLLTMLAAICAAASLDAQEKKPLDHDVYDDWRSIRDPTLSDDGRWVLYSLVPQNGDAELMVQSLSMDTAYSVARGASARFSEDARFVVFLIKPEKELVRQAKREKKEPAEQPKDSLGVLSVASGEIARIERVQSFKMPEEGSGWVAYLLEKPTQADSTESGEEKPDTAERADGGNELVLRNLETGAERRLGYVSTYAFSKDGARLVYTSSGQGDGDGIYIVTVAIGGAVPILAGEGVYKAATFDEPGEQVAFLSDRDAHDADQPSFALYYWRVGWDEARELAKEGARGIPAGWWVSEHGSLSFSDNGERLFFGTVPRPEPEPEDDTPDDEKVKVDLWHWRDPYLQPQQLLQAERERKRTYRAVVHLRNRRVVQLATEDVPTVTVGAEGDGDVALGISELPYRQLTSWDSPGYRDAYLIDVASGTRRRILDAVRSRVRLSPEGRYAYWWDRSTQAWFAMDVASGNLVNLTQGIGYPVYNEQHDWPYLPNPYGSAGWTEGDEDFLVYDKHDLWATDPRGRAAPRNLTEGVGRDQNLRFRYVRLDPDEPAIDPRAPILLAAFHLKTKAAGFYRDRVRGTRGPERLLFSDHRFSNPTKSDDAEVLLFTRSTFEEFPDLWASDLDFEGARKVSQANPQQAEYFWGTAELVEWRSVDGRPLQGILYKPENFDPAKRYPMMVYFYEKNSQNLHRHWAPEPHRSIINFTFYVSRGYLVFVPDIPYRVGYPGESALNAVAPGVLSLVRQGFVDADNIGVQGHSWGGYQVAFLVTRTNMFKAAEAGAPVSNMVSAYGGIRWGSGRSRMFQYERTQSRIGGSLWETPMRYIENSPIFWADKIETPLLIMHNDGDGAVPWYQGIELFVALRRLSKPVWLVNYNGEPHWPTTFHNKKDWAIRMQQFFDHYLQGAPAPVWLARGVPAIRKGKTLGYELVSETVRAGSESRPE